MNYFVTVNFFILFAENDLDDFYVAIIYENGIIKCRKKSLRNIIVRIATIHVAESMIMKNT